MPAPSLPEIRDHARASLAALPERLHALKKSGSRLSGRDIKGAGSPCRARPRRRCATTRPDVSVEAETRKREMMMIVGDQGEVRTFLETVLSARHGTQPDIRETHISTILLAGDEAFKLKRPIRTPYLDFSTPHLRLEACEAEIALNRRTAPGDLPRGPTHHPREQRQTRPGRLGRTRGCGGSPWPDSTRIPCSTGSPKAVGSTSPGSMRSPTRSRVFMIRPNPVPHGTAPPACARSSP